MVRGPFLWHFAFFFPPFLLLRKLWHFHSGGTCEWLDMIPVPESGFPDSIRVGRFWVLSGFRPWARYCYNAALKGLKKIKNLAKNQNRRFQFLKVINWNRTGFGPVSVKFGTSCWSVWFRFWFRLMGPGFGSAVRTGTVIGFTCDWVDHLN